MQPIDAYLSNPPPGYALLLSGAWGAGKSFYWTRYANKLDGITPITVSVAGLQSNEELESALFLASIKELSSSPFGEAGAVIGKALLRLVKIEPSDITFKADIAPGKSVICIDDVERFAGDFQVLFGFIVNLIDASGVHCILIADERRAIKRLDDYETFKERIVGKTVLVHPSIRDFCEQSINSSASLQSRTALMAGLDRIVQLVSNARLKNLRTVRFFMTELDAVVRALKPDAAAQVMESSLPSAMLFWAIATARSPKNIKLVEKAFKEKVGMALAMHRTKKKSSAINDAAPDKPPTETDLLATLIESMGMADEAYGWPQSKAFITMARGGEINYDELALDFKLEVQQSTAPRTTSQSSRTTLSGQTM